MIHNILNNWNLFRLIRLGVGLLILVEGVKTGVWAIAGFGLLFSILPLLHIGCCAAGNCAVPSRRSTQAATEDVSYEEIKNR